MPSSPRQSKRKTAAKKGNPSATSAGDQDRSTPPPARPTHDSETFPEDIYQVVFNNPCIGIALADPQGVIRYCNETAAAMLGYDANEMIGKTINDVTHEQDRAWSDERLKQFRSAPDKWYQIQKRYRRKDGSVMWGRLTVYPMMNNSGGLLYSVGMLEDITEQKIVEQERENFFELSVDPMCVAGMDGYFKRLNPAWKRVLGYESNELLRRPFVDFVHPDDKKNTMRELHKLQHGIKTVKFLNRYRAKNGDYVWLMWTSFPFIEQSLIYAVAHDVTELKQAEQELLTYQTRLEELVEHRTSELISINMRLQKEARERAAAEKRLAENLARYRTLFELSPSGILVEDAEGNILDVNPAHCTSLGYDRDTLIGNKIHMLAHDEVLGLVDENLRRIMQGETLRHTVRSNRKDGALCYMVLNETRIPLGDGRDGVLVISHDVTELKQTEQALRSKEARIRAILDALPDLMFQFDASGRFVDYRAPDQDMLAVGPDQFVGRHLGEVSLPDDLKQITLTTITEVLETRQVRQAEYSLTLEGRGERHYECRGVPCGDNDVLFFVRDITDRIEGERALRESEERFRTLVGNVPGVVYRRAHDESWTAEYVSDAIEEITGFPAAGFIHNADRSLASLVLPEDLPHVRDQIARAVEKRRSYHLEYRIVDSIGRIRWVFEKGVGVYDGSGELHWLDGAMYDMTERKKNEEKLELALEAANQASRAKAEFLANMSHEIRTPMNAVIGMTRMLMDTPLTAEQKEYTETLNQSARGLLSIINDILDFSKIEAGRVELEHVPFSLTDCLREACDIIEVSARQKALTLNSNLAPEVPGRVIGDPARLRQVILNLLDNAVKFTESGGVTLTVTAKSMGHGRMAVNFAVSDSGIGIPAEKMDRLFLSFSQVEASTTRKYGGSGLGLAISQKLVQLMDGRIEVESRPGDGSKFWFTIPMDIAPPLEGKLSTAAPTSDMSPQPGAQGVHLLLAEDNALNEKVLTLMLTKWNIATYDVARNGVEALERLAEKRYDLVLMDCQMPEMDGYEATRRLRDMELGGRGRTPVVALTASALQGERERCLEAGMDDYLSKPVDRTALIEMIRRFVKQ